MREALLLVLLAATIGIDLAVARPLPASPTPPLACRALEVHADATLGVTIVVFHQRDDDDRGRVGALLREHDGAAIEFQTTETTDGAWHPATLMRLKSCFGRGLLLFRLGAAPLVEKGEFLLREPEGGAR